MSLRFRPMLDCLDRRDLPSATVVEPTEYTMTGPWGSATATVTVTQEDDGYYHWDYELRNDSYVMPGSPNDTYIGLFVLPVEDSSLVTNITSSMGWQTYAGPYASHVDTIVWHAGEFGPQLAPGSSAEFGFTTPVVSIGLADAEAADPMYAGGSGGQLLAPVPPLTVDQYMAKLDELNAAIQDVQQQENSLLFLMKRAFYFSDLRAQKQAELNAELAKPPAQQNAQLIQQLEADIVAADAENRNCTETYDQQRPYYEAAHENAMKLESQALAMYNLLTARNIEVPERSLVPDLKSNEDFIRLAKQ